MVMEEWSPAGSWAGTIKLNIHRRPGQTESTGQDPHPTLPYLQAPPSSAVPSVSYPPYLQTCCHVMWAPSPTPHTPVVHSKALPLRWTGLSHTGSCTKELCLPPLAALPQMPFRKCASTDPNATSAPHYHTVFNITA